MERIKPHTLSGFMELLPEDQKKMQRVMATLRESYALYGFTPLDTPAIEAADVVLMTDEPSRIAPAIRIARRTLGIVRGNIALALGIKGAVLLAGAFGFVSMWGAVFADVGVTLLAILNALRALGGVNSR